ncbi:MAG: mRNA deadenylase 3'-5' endonuclease subunit Ccr4 [Myxococcota bacterium]|jgi:mRNA deadenylase 3'-5' endonuclease subunit Ccr4
MLTTPLSVVTYNVLAESYVRPGRYRGVDPVALEPTARRQRVLDRIAGLDADVLCLQEVEPDVFEALTTRLTSHDGRFAKKLGRPEGSAIFVRRDALSIESTHTLRYTHGDKCALAFIVHLSDGLSVASTHLQWAPPRTARDQHIGRLQLIELLAYVDARPDTWLLTGDLNDISEGMVIQAAAERGWKLSCRTQRPWDSSHINGRRRKLDYLLYRSEQLRPEPGTLPTLTGDTPLPTLTEPSDHLPVLVRYTPA